MTASAFQVMLRDLFSPLACVSTASCVATSASRQPPRHAHVVERRVAGVITDPLWLAPQYAQGHTTHPRCEWQSEERQSADSMLSYHQGEAFAVREPLPLCEEGRVAEAVLHDGRFGDKRFRAGVTEPPAQLDVFARRKAWIESEGKQRLALDQRRRETEPVLAPTRPM